MRVTLSPSAQRDRRAIERFYRSESPAAARRFREQLQNALKYIREYPDGSPRVGSRRLKRVLDFPFSVVYEIHRTRIRVMAIADQRRDPESSEYTEFV